MIQDIGCNRQHMLVVFIFLTIFPIRAQQNISTGKRLSDIQYEDSLFQSSTVIDGKWWRNFEDPQLDSLIGMAIDNNYNLSQAMHNIAIAKARIRIGESQYYPSIDLSAGWTQSKNSSETTRIPATGADTDTRYYSIGAGASWEIDLFGSIRNRVKSLKEQYNASKEEYNGVMVSLCAEVATAYAGLRMSQQQYQVAERNIKSQAEILRIVEVRYHTGLASQLDLLQAKTIYYNTQATLPGIETDINRYINTLCVLTGSDPDTMRRSLVPVKPIPGTQRYIRPGIPADVLRQRPDIRASERNVAALAAALGAARTDWFPQFFVKANIGFAAYEADRLFNHNSLTYEIAPSVSWPVFTGMKRSQSIVLAREQLDAEIDNFNQAVLIALQEVDDAIHLYRSSIRQKALMKEVIEQGNETLKLSFQLYKGGLIDFQNVLDAQRSLLNYENALVAAEGAAMRSLVELYRSLGGGWQ